jgi:hypothetical protein
LDEKDGGDMGLIELSLWDKLKRIKADKVVGAVEGNFAKLDANGNLVDSGHKDADYEDADATILKEADVVDSLDSTSTTAPLSANQGKVLNDAIDEVEGRVEDAEDAITAIKGTGYTEGSLKTHEDRLDTLEGADTVEGSVLKDIKDNAEDATYDNTDSGLTASTIKTAIDEVEGRIDDAETALTTLNADDTTEGSVAKSIKDAVDPIEARIDTTELTLARQGQDLASVKQTLQQGNGATLDFSDIGIVPLDARATGRANPTVEGLTATNLVTNGDFSDGITGWIEYSADSLSIAGDYIKCLLKSNSSSIGQTIVPVAGNKYFIACIAKMESSAVSDANFVIAKSSVGAEESANISIGTTDTYCSTIMTSVANRDFIGLGRVTTAQNIYIKKNSFVLLDLTSIFGAGNEPSEAECKKLFSNYFEGTKSIPMPARLRSVGKNLFVPSKYVFNSTYNSYGLPLDEILTVGKTFTLSVSDGIYSKISLGPGSGSGDTKLSYSNTAVRVFAWTQSDANKNYYLWLSDSSRSILRSVESVEVQLELGSVATPYEPYQDSNLYIADKEDGRSVPAIKDQIKVINGELVKVQNVQRYVLQESDFSGTFNSAVSGWNIGAATLGVLQGQNTSIVGSSSITGKAFFPIREIPYTDRTTVVLTDDCFYVGQSSGLFLIGFPANKYASMTEVMDVYVGTVIYYQLETPIITPLLTSGILQAKPNGTVYFEPYYEGSHQTNASSQIALPYEGTIEAVYGYDEDLVEYLLDSSEYSLTGTTLTITDALENEVFFVQMSRSEPLAPEMSVNTLNNEQVIADTSNGKFYKLVPTITNGSLVSQTPVEVV